MPAGGVRGPPAAAGPEKRLKASIVIPYEDADASVAEIERWAGHPDMVQIFLLSRTVEPLGHRRYWPIYRAAAEAGLPIGIHAFGNGGTPTTGTGWPSFYIEDMIGHAQSCQSLVSSMVLEALKLPVTPERRRAFFVGNARRLYLRCRWQSWV